jgi:parallel beta-helix repeat protein
VGGALVIANVVHDNFGGICFFDVGGGEIRDNTAERNTIGIADSGGGPGGPNLVIGNRTRNNEAGIFVGSGATTRVDMNEVSGNVYGIALQIASGGVVSRNTVVKNDLIGIVAGDSSGFKIDSNTVRENGQFGIFVLHANNCAVDENSVARNGEGIHLQDISSCQAYRNVVQQNQSIGINALDLGPGDVFVFNTASGNRVLDCNWDGSDAPTFANNRCAIENPPGAWD